MLEIINKTPFNVALVPGLDCEGYDKATVIIKGTFHLENGSDVLPLSEEQVPIIWADEYYGEPGGSSVKYESDTAMTKTATDVVLVGHAYASGRRQTKVDIQLRVGSLHKHIRVFGDRRWSRSGGRWEFSDPEPFERIPLTYERAYGGSDQSIPDPSKRDHEGRNPIGTGFTIAADNGHLDGRALPNIEDPANLIKNWKDRPSPTGVGFIGRNWHPRITYAGTYDDEWQRERCPLLPLNFNDFYFQGASTGMIATPHLMGGESVLLENVSASGPLRFQLPRRPLHVLARIGGKESLLTPSLDTVVIEPDLSRIALTWRSTISCPRKFLYIELLRITEESRT